MSERLAPNPDSDELAFERTLQDNMDDWFIQGSSGETLDEAGNSEVAAPFPGEPAAGETVPFWVTLGREYAQQAPEAPRTESSGKVCMVDTPSTVKGWPPHGDQVID